MISVDIHLMIKLGKSDYDISMGYTKLVLERCSMFCFFYSNHWPQVLVVQHLYDIHWYTPVYEHSKIFMIDLNCVAPAGADSNVR